jgi:hypothetical protein
MEAELGRKIQVALCKTGARVWRNNVGLGWIGKAIHCNGDVILKDARPLHSGLCEGSSDFIGIYRGRFLAVEVKTARGVISEAQGNFIKMVNDNGGIAFVARSEQQALEELNAANLRLR